MRIWRQHSRPCPGNEAAGIGSADRDWRQKGGRRRLIVFFTDFGVTGPYVGQMHAVARSLAPGVELVDLMHDAPAFQPRPAGHLLAALMGDLPPGIILVGVVDPGVGTQRRAVALEIGPRRLVGPDNGLFDPLLRQADRKSVV